MSSTGSRLDREADLPYSEDMTNPTDQNTGRSRRIVRLGDAAIDRLIEKADVAYWQAIDSDAPQAQLDRLSDELIAAQELAR